MACREYSRSLTTHTHTRTLAHLLHTHTHTHRGHGGSRRQFDGDCLWGGRSLSQPSYPSNARPRVVQTLALYCAPLSLSPPPSLSLPPPCLSPSPLFPLIIFSPTHTSLSFAYLMPFAASLWVAAHIWGQHRGLCRPLGTGGLDGCPCVHENAEWRGAAFLPLSNTHIVAQSIISLYLLFLFTHTHTDHYSLSVILMLRQGLKGLLNEIGNEIQRSTWMYERYGCPGGGKYERQGEHSPYFFEVYFWLYFLYFHSFFVDSLFLYYIVILHFQWPSVYAISKVGGLYGIELSFDIWSVDPLEVSQFSYLTPTIGIPASPFIPCNSHTHAHTDSSHTLPNIL